MSYLILILNLVFGALLGIILAQVLSPKNISNNQRLQRFVVTGLFGYIGVILGPTVLNFQNLIGNNLFDSGFNLIPAVIGSIILSLIAIYGLNNIFNS